ncbi:MAG: hypothetical protein KF699_14045 [Phycisphaeraceae bacterium]|jgi:hypothetical protein|nr:hypothetical protein [Phycisphaeraceae bacterium]MBX3407946.1 hypothetical protein [Phycisphaeraceae bacterium]MBY0261421.1 hypothetical protein [Phycisphaerales bacterium]
MAGLERFDNLAWDRFFDFVAPDVAQMSMSELDAELQRAGVDMTKAVASVRLALDARAAREKLARAREMRATITKKLCDYALGPMEDARQILHQMISTCAPQAQRGVLFRKLEQAATDDDVRSLLEDIQRLEQLDPGGGDVQP